MEKKLGQVIPSLYNTTLHNSSLPARRNSGRKKISLHRHELCGSYSFFPLSLPSFLFFFLSIQKFRNSKIPTQRRRKRNKKRKVLIGRNNARTCSNGFKFFIRENISRERERFTIFFLFESKRGRKRKNSRRRTYVYFSRGFSTKFKQRRLYPLETKQTKPLSCGEYQRPLRDGRVTRSNEVRSLLSDPSVSKLAS